MPQLALLTLLTPNYLPVQDWASRDTGTRLRGHEFSTRKRLSRQGHFPYLGLLARGDPSGISRSGDDLLRAIGLSRRSLRALLKAKRERVHAASVLVHQLPRQNQLQRGVEAGAFRRSTAPGMPHNE